MKEVEEGRGEGGLHARATGERRRAGLTLTGGPRQYSKSAACRRTSTDLCSSLRCLSAFLVPPSLLPTLHSTGVVLLESIAKELAYPSMTCPVTGKKFKVRPE